ncbi:MAG: PD-(D/E)XK nuclease family protein [Puniceicoccales bacterium]|jgi:hypothetical protein|nr:PD-(D/E)XK nuclease family protein [Puniceicoccales bacterium]
MPGFITNHFVFMEEHLLHEIRSVEKFSELPSLILCHSPIEIAFLKQFFSKHGCIYDSLCFYTFDTFVSEFLKGFTLQCPIISIADLKFLTNSKQLYLDSQVLLRFFLEENFVNQRGIDSETLATLRLLEEQMRELNWQMPRQALKTIMANSPKLFTKCILFGFSSREHLYTYFLEFIQKITHHVTFFAFDWGDSELATFELLESIFGSAVNINENIPREPLIFQNNFALVDDPIDATAYIQQLLSFSETQENTGIICLSPIFATLVAHHLEILQIPFHNGFSTPLTDSRDNLIFAWHRWQMKNDFESFMQFCHYLQPFEPNLLPQGIDICEILNKIFNAYPSFHVRDLADFSENFYLKNILEHYPMLLENGSFCEFSEKTSLVIPEMIKHEKYFTKNFQTTKKAFLDYAFHCYFESKPPSNESHFAPIFLLDSQSAAQLQFDKIIIFFQDISNNFPLPLLRAGSMHYIAMKSGISVDFIELYQMRMGKFLDINTIQSIHFSLKKNSKNNRKQYDSLRRIHQIRNDKNSNFSEFEYTIPEIRNYSLPITAIEYAYSNPEEIWYSHILQNDRPQLLLQKSKLEGVLTHSLLHLSHNFFPSFQEFQQYIISKKQHFRQKFTNIPSQILLQEIIDSAAIKAFVIAKKLAAFERFPFIANEVDLHTITTLFEENSFSFHGRIDCILSLYPFRKTFHQDNAQNDILLIDFKTGATSQNDLRKLVKKFTTIPQSLSGLQLVLYGLMLRTLGYQNIQLLILNSDPYDHAESLHLDMITFSENFKFIRKYLKVLLNDGIFGYSQPHPFGKTYFSAPIAILPPNSEVIQNKRKQLFL